jgi:hypothetical protein
LAMPHEEKPRRKASVLIRFVFLSFMLIFHPLPNKIGFDQNTIIFLRLKYRTTII